MHLGQTLYATTTCLASAVILSACGSSGTASDASTVAVVASTDVYGDIAKAVGGEHVSVTTFISSPSQDPHSYEASSRDILLTSKADVVIENGGGYDDFVDQLVDSADGSPTVLNAVDISGYSAPDGGTLNEHVWYDVPTMQRVTDDIVDALGNADPDHAGAYVKNAQALGKGLESLAKREADLRSSLDGLGVAVTEPVPGYLLDAVGAVDLTPDEFSEAIEGGDDVPVVALNDTLSLFTEHQVGALVYNEQTTGTITQQVKQAAEDSGVPVVSMTETLPDGDTYLTWMNANVDALEQALSRP